jgi:hypothetical protein
MDGSNVLFLLMMWIDVYVDVPFPQEIAGVLQLGKYNPSAVESDNDIIDVESKSMDSDNSKRKDR